MPVFSLDINLKKENAPVIGSLSSLFFLRYCRHLLHCCYTLSHPKIFLPQSQGWIPWLDLCNCQFQSNHQTLWSFSPWNWHANQYRMNSVIWSSLWTFQTLSCSFALAGVFVFSNDTQGSLCFPAWHWRMVSILLRFVFLFLDAKRTCEIVHISATSDVRW